MRVLVKGLKRTTRTLADGSKKEFIYLRATGAPIHGKPGTPEFMASYISAVAATRAIHSGQFRAIIAKYKASTEFTKLATKTQKAYLSYIARIELEFGSMPIAAINDPRSRSDFLEWRDGMSATPRAADYAWTTLARILSWGKN